MSAFFFSVIQFYVQRQYLHICVKKKKKRKNSRQENNIY